MPVWTILYGGVQASAPKLLKAKSRPLAALIRDARIRSAALIAVPAVLAALVFTTLTAAPWLTATIVAGLLGFGAICAVNSALHSDLILAFSSDDR